ncbi:MAG: glycosyltransferase family 4 protein [Campylobacterales bacterium]|nr:glycosyltransferase family 4 protein [Campylobacterales bacterium]
MESLHIAILDVDGNEWYDMRLIEAWREQSHIKVHLYSDFDTLEVRGKKFFTKGSTLLGHIFAAVKSLKDAKANGVKLLITPIHQLNIKTFITLLIAKWQGLNSAGVVHDIAPALHGKRVYLYHWMRRYLLSHIVVHNRFAYEQLIANSEHIEKFHLIKHGHYLDTITNTQPREMLRVKLKFEKDTKYLLFMVDTIYKEHGLDLLIEALAQIEKGDTHLIIVGNIADETLKNSYKQLIRELKLNNSITQHSAIDEETKAMLLSACDAIVFPYYQSYRNEYILKAMSYSIPVIASNIAVHQELIKERFSGLLFAHGDGRELGKVLNYFLEYKYLATDLPREAFKVIRDNYNWKESAKGYLKLIS